MICEVIRYLGSPDTCDLAPGKGMDRKTAPVYSQYKRCSLSFSTGSSVAAEPPSSRRARRGRYPVFPHCGVVGNAHELKSVHWHCAKKHLHRYAGESEFRYNNREGNGVDDAARAEAALKGVKGERLLYSDSFVG